MNAEVIKMNDYEYFRENLSALYEKYGHRFLVIKNCTIIGAYNSFDDAYIETTKTEPLGTFLIQECVSDSAELMQLFQGNISVAI
jgi:hypothetical protein